MLGSPTVELQLNMEQWQMHITYQRLPVWVGCEEDCSNYRWEWQYLLCSGRVFVCPESLLAVSIPFTECCLQRHNVSVLLPADQMAPGGNTVNTNPKPFFTSKKKVSLGSYFAIFCVFVYWVLMQQTNLYRSSWRVFFVVLKNNVLTLSLQHPDLEAWVWICVSQTLRIVAK